MEKWGIGPGGAARDQPAPGDAARYGLRAGRPLREAPRLRHAGRGHERLRPSDRPGGRAAHPAAVRARRRRRGPRRGVRRDARALPPRVERRSRPGGRPVPARAADGLLGPGPSTYDQLGVVPGRHGNRSPNNAPRNAYKTKDNRWVAISASATSVATRVMGVVGRPDIAESSGSPRPGSASGTPTASTGRGGVDRRARVRRGDAGVPGRRRRDSADLRHGAARRRPARPGPGCSGACRTSTWGRC